MRRLKGATAILALLAAPAIHACQDDSTRRDEDIDPRPSPGDALAVTRLFPTAENPGVERSDCTLASPLAWEEEGRTSIVVAEGAGTVSAYDAETGKERWSVALPASEGEKAYAVATPAIVAGAKLLVVGYHTTTAGEGRLVSDVRLRHRVAVIDLAAHRIDPRFAPVDLSATISGHGGDVPFRAAHAIGRGAIVVGRRPADTFGRAYVTFGNVRDIQPWHGWIFELDLDAWSAGGAAVSATRVTTPESDCGPEGASGSRERRCGGGLWAPSGPLVRARGDDYELVLPAGNGQLDLARGDYANTLMRTTRGLPFDPSCDPALCAGIDPANPTEACVASCRDLFVPRIPAGDPPFSPASGVCDDRQPFFDCWARLDYVGGSTPALVRLPSGREVLVLAPKDGHAYVVDADHLGTLLDRRKLVENCGTREDRCRADWAGMAVTQPEVLDTPEGPLVFVPTFMFDRTHAAGIVALRVRERDGGVKLEQAWTFPSFDGDDAVRLFRQHPTRPRLVREGPRGQPMLVVGEIIDGQSGILWTLRATDGALLARTPLAGAGMRFAQPLAVADKIYLPSCATAKGPGTIEGYRLGP
ncbi:MAG: PQQ-binding-like beta-propeller repeat protein [Labilithrix sp.]|nr:PQQ-binding-like beta-propeller repeat protein [Labilithrix sp.]